MTFVLPLPSHGSLKRSFSDSPYLHSVQAQVASRSCYSVFSRQGSNISIPSSSPCRVQSSDLNKENKTLAFNRKPHIEHLETLSPGGVSPSIGHDNHQIQANSPNLYNASRSSDSDICRLSGSQCPECGSLYPQSSIGDEEEAEELSSFESSVDSKDTQIVQSVPEWSLKETENPEEPKTFVQPFRKWVETLRRRNGDQQGPMHPRRLSQPQNFPQSSNHDLSDIRHWHCEQKAQGHRRSISMSSSFGFVAAMKSASITIASASIAPKKRVHSTKTGTDGLLSTCSHSDARMSHEYSRFSMLPLVDDGAWNRAVERRKILTELISSEESYICDMKLLVNAYFTLLASVPSVSIRSRSAFHKNVAQILHLHEDLLAEIQKHVSRSGPYENDPGGMWKRVKSKHTRCRSTDTTLSRFKPTKTSKQTRHSLDLRSSTGEPKLGVIGDTSIVREVVKVFNNLSRRFFVYEAFGAQWTAMKVDIDCIRKSVPLSAYEKGTEALAGSLLSIQSRESKGKKGLTYEDLLIKPIQRMSKYPLIFERLCKQTPVIDDPETHAELEKGLFRLKEINSEINRATNDHETRTLIESTWMLQDRLVFEEKTLPATVIFRLLGHVNLCGVLHVTFDTVDKVFGQYMICVLYRSSLVLALLDKPSSHYKVMISIGLTGAAVEDCDNGRGLQCYTAPYTWKLVFESNQNLYEVILSACSCAEEEQWRSKLRSRILAENKDLIEGRTTFQDMFSYMLYDLKPVGSVFGHSNSFARRLSVRRAATLGAKNGLQQVIIKNTQAQIPSQNSATPTVTRSKSYQSSNSIQIIASRRATRARLELALSDVWTKDFLPYPGILPKRPENGIRASANSVMRKLSMASLASNFSKRSPSLASSNNSRLDESQLGLQKPSPVPINETKIERKRKVPVIVDFHNAPNAFLPTDFEIKPISSQSRMAVRDREVLPGRINDHMRLPSPSFAATISSDQFSGTAGSGDGSASSNRFLDQTKISIKDEKSGATGPRKLETHRSKGTPSLNHHSMARRNKRSLKQKGSRIFKFWA